MCVFGSSFVSSLVFSTIKDFLCRFHDRTFQRIVLLPVEHHMRFLDTAWGLAELTYGMVMQKLDCIALHVRDPAPPFFFLFPAFCFAFGIYSTRFIFMPAGMAYFLSTRCHRFLAVSSLRAVYSFSLLCPIDMPSSRNIFRPSVHRRFLSQPSCYCQRVNESTIFWHSNRFSPSQEKKLTACLSKSDSSPSHRIF